MNAACLPFTVSVVIPVYNGAAFLAAAMASVRAQTFPPKQIIIVDDGSTDDTPRVAQGLGANVEYIAQENCGPAVARNRGIAAARGDLVAFLDADDLWPPDKLATQVEYLARHPTADVVLGPTRLFEEPGAESPRYHFADNGGSTPPLMFLLGAALFRRAVFEKVGGFDPAKRISDDLDWFIRAREQAIAITVIGPVGLFKRCHDHNLTRGKSIAQLGVAAAVRESLLRRRKQGGPVQPLADLHRDS